MSNKNLCTRFAQVSVNGKTENSKLHEALLNKIPNRAVANLVYAMYLQQKNAVDTALHDTLNSQKEPSVDSLLKYFGAENIITDIADSTIKAIERSKGVRDSNDQLHNFDDPMTAYKKARDINEMKNKQGESAHLAATVVQHDRQFQVLVHPVSSSTNLRAREIENSIFLWNSLKTALGTRGVDLDSLRVPFSDILSMSTGMTSYIENMSKTNNKYLTQREIQFLISANINSPLVQQLLSVYNGDTETAATAIYDNYHVSKNPGYAGLIDKVMTESKNLFSILDSAFNAQTIDKVASETAASAESETKTILKQLNKKYGIDYNQIVLNQKHVKSLSEATAKAVAIIEKRINKLETIKGTTAEVKRLSRLRDTLLKELESKRYYMGIFNYLNDAYNIVEGLNNALDNRPINGTSFENALALARILNEQDMYVGGYANLFRDLIEDLSNIELVTIDESLSKEEIEEIKTQAKNTLELLNNVKRRGEDLTIGCVRDIITHLIGDQVGPEVIEQIVQMEHIKNWGLDILYSFGKLSDPLSAAIGDMVRSTQDDRNDALQKYTIRIREATAKLYKSKSNSEFMYENDGHIISDYDWGAYSRAYNIAKSQLINQGLKGYDLDEAMELWEEANTEDLVVDKKGNRTEKVPKLSLYRKRGPSFRDRLSKEQLEYYDTMMQIKGELGSLLPEWAQMHFLPPQLRRDLVTACTHIKEDGLDKFSSALKDKIEGEYKVMQDDTEWGIGGQRPGSYAFAKGDLSGTEVKQIPIFFVNKLSNQDELFKNFSAGLQAFAGTAENYWHMSNIVDVAEFLHTYIKNTTQQVGEENAGNKTTNIVTRVKSSQMTMMNMILDSMIDKHFYNKEIKGNPFFAKMVGHLTAYTSFKGLATNTFGAAANLIVGEQQLFQMATANTLYKVFTKSKTPYFGLTDWMYGFIKLFGEPLKAGFSAVAGKKHVPSVILDLCTNNKQSKDYLMAEQFDLFNENYGTMLHTKYYKGARQLLHDISFIMYEAGEKAIRYNTLWAMQKNTKLKHEGKTINLRQAYYKTGYKASPHLELKADLFDLDGSRITDSNGNLTDYGKQYMRTFKKNLRYCCQGMFGAMNNEDKGVIHTYTLGRAIMNFRQWSVAHYSERYRGVHWDMDKHEFVRGYWTSSGRYLAKSVGTEETQELLQHKQYVKFMGNFVKNLLTFRTHFIKEWTKSSETQKLDLTRVMSAAIQYVLAYGVGCWIGGGLVPKLIWGDEDDEKKRKKKMTPTKKFCYYQVKRVLYESENSAPLGFFINFENNIKSPIPAIRTFDSALYPITGLKDLGTPIRSGQNKGEDKYWRNIKKYCLPFWRDYYRLKDFPESDAMFGYIEDTNQQN